MGRRHVMIGAAVLLVGCSSSRDANPVVRPTRPPPTSVAATGGDTSATTSSTGSSGTATSTSTTAGATTTSTTATAEVRGVAVAGTAGGLEGRNGTFNKTNPYAEAVRLRDGSCAGWSGSRAGSTAGLDVGAAVVVLAAEENEEIGRGMIQASRWEDMSNGGAQWNCLFDFTATITGSPAEFRIKVADLEPWLARPDPAAPETFVASVNSNASIGLIPACPAVPDPASTPTTAPRRRRARMVSGWNAIGLYWSRGVAELCRAGLPVTAIARPCRPPGAGSEYITEVVNSRDSDITYENGAAVPIGTEMTVVVATGRLCE